MARLIVIDPDPRQGAALLARHGLAADGGVTIRWISRPGDLALVVPGTPVLFGDDRDWPVFGPSAGLMDETLRLIRAGVLRPATPDDLAAPGGAGRAA